jgi:hypothetical protein
MKAIQRILESGSTLSLLVLSFIATLCSAGLGLLGFALLHTHAYAAAPNPMERPVTTFVAPTQVEVAAPEAGDSSQSTSTVAKDSKTASGTGFLHGSLNGSLKPAKDQPWRHWLQ